MWTRLVYYPSESQIIRLKKFMLKHFLIACLFKNSIKTAGGTRFAWLAVGKVAFKIHYKHSLGRKVYMLYSSAMHIRIDKNKFRTVLAFLRPSCKVPLSKRTFTAQILIHWHRSMSNCWLARQSRYKHSRRGRSASVSASFTGRRSLKFYRSILNQDAAYSCLNAWALFYVDMKINDNPDTGFSVRAGRLADNFVGVGGYLLVNFAKLRLVAKLDSGGVDFSKTIIVILKWHRFCWLPVIYHAMNSKRNRISGFTFSCRNEQGKLEYTADQCSRVCSKANQHVQPSYKNNFAPLARANFFLCTLGTREFWKRLMYSE